LINPTHRTQCVEAVVDTSDDAFLACIGSSLGTHGALDIQNNLLCILGILFKILAKQSQAVCVGRAVELSAIKVVAARVNGRLDGSNCFLFSDRAGYGQAFEWMLLAIRIVK
jgi:hypothetical protein